jgi:hypothetical protein
MHCSIMSARYVGLNGADCPHVLLALMGTITYLAGLNGYCYTFQVRAPWEHIGLNGYYSTTRCVRLGNTRS